MLVGMPAQREELLTAALDSLPFPIASVDREGKILFLNQVAAENLSGTRDALVGTSVFEHFDEAAAVAARERIRQAIKAKTVQRFESVVKLPDGRERQYASLYCPAVDEAGNVFAVQIASREVTEVVGSEAAPLDGLWGVISDDLSMTPARVNAVLKNAPIVVSVYDPDMTIRYMNRVLEGVDRAEVIGKTPLGWITADTQPAMRRTFAQVVETKQVAECEVTGVSGRSWLVRLAPLIHDGEVRQVLGCTLDITEQKRLQSELAQRQRIESLGTMARGVAHDFNNLLTVILGSTGLARRQTPAGRDIGGLLDDIESASRRAASLCEQMLVYSGRNSTSTEPGDLNAVIAEMTPLTRAATGSQIRVVQNLAAGLRATVCNPAQLGQVVLNLVNNAADAIGDACGSVTISTDEIVLTTPAEGCLPRSPPPGRYVRLRVADDGPGVPPGVRDRIFDPFYTTKATGHGLGLSVVLGIVSSRGGAIAFDSAEGGGTRVTVLLPAMDRVATREPTESNDQVWPRGEGVVLVVDDEAAVRKLLTSVLTAAGYQVVEADQGDAGLEMLSRHASSVRAAILDVTMPLRSGYEVLAELRKTHPRLPVWLSSGRAIEVPQHDSFLRVLAKPYSPLELLRALAEEVG